jgi:hypothetical protein
MSQDWKTKTSWISSKRDVNAVSYREIGGQTKVHTNREQYDSTGDMR